MEDDRALSCAAVGLWYRIRRAERHGPITDADLLTVVADPTTWHPDGEVEDVSRPLDELLATGWVDLEGGVYRAVTEVS